MDIYGTIGPACADFDTLREMFRLGMTGMRLNLSHVELSACQRWTEMIRKAAEAAGVSPRLLVDLQGPELRIGVLKAPLRLREGEQLLLSSSRVRNESVVCVQELLLSVLSPGQQVLLDDGKILLDVTEICEHGAKCNVRQGGMLASRKSIALPGVDLQLPTLTDSDRKNLREARAHGVTGVMLPFVRSPKDLQNLRQELEKAFEPQLQVFAKIENIDGVNNLESLLPHADYIVIARGDLGNSMPLWELPGVQADIARRCQRADKPFMVVTQMLASMEKSKVPTRAEVSDIFLAVSQGASSVMVTGETASGSYPTEAIRYLCQTTQHAAKYLETSGFPSAAGTAGKD